MQTSIRQRQVPLWALAAATTLLLSTAAVCCIASAAPETGGAGGGNAGGGNAAGGSPGSASSDSPDEPFKPIVYHPRAGLRLGTRVLPADRGPSSPLPALFILTPREDSLTSQASPAVSWFLSAPADVKGVALMLTVSRRDRPEPLIEESLDASQAGIGWLDLDKKRVKLEKEVPYTVAVALRLDKTNRVLSSGVIICVDVPRPLRDALDSRTSAVERASVFAEEGFWLDALYVLSSQIEPPAAAASAAAGTRGTARNRSMFLEHRASLLEQVGLNQPAKHDRAMAKAVMAQPAPARGEQPSAGATRPARSGRGE